MKTSKILLFLLLSAFVQNSFAQTDSLTQALFNHIRYHTKYNIDGRYHKYYKTQTLIEAGADVNALDEKGNSPVHICAKNGDLINLKLLYYYKADLHKKNSDGKTALQIAEKMKNKAVIEFLKHPVLDGYFYAGHGTVDELKIYLKKHAGEINKPGKYGNTMLFYATGRNNEAYEVVEFLISKGADINFSFQDILDVSIRKENLNLVNYFCEKNPNELSGRPLNIAIQTNNTDIVKLMIDKGADVNIKDIHGYSPIYYAMIYQGENHEIIRLLIEKGADVNAKTSDKTALFLAVGTPYDDDPYFDYYNYSIDTSIVRMLLEAGAVYNIQDRYEETPLSYALKNKDSNQLLKLFIKCGKDKELNNLFLQEMIFKAAENNDIESMVFCLQKGVDINTSDNYRYTALHFAVEKPENNKMLEFLIEKGADINVNKGTSYLTPVMYAVQNNNIKAVRLLLDKGAVLTDVDNHNVSQLLISASRYKNNSEIVKMLLESGANVNIVDSYYGTPLNIASSLGNLETVKILIDYGADVKTRRSDVTPLHHLATNKNAYELVELLIEKDADVEALDSNDQTPLHYAVMGGNENIIELIKKHQKTEKRKPRKKRNAFMQENLIIRDRISIDSSNYFGTGYKRDKLDILYRSLFFEYENIGDIDFVSLVYNALMKNEFKKYNNYDPYTEYSEKTFPGNYFTVENVNVRFDAGIDTSYDISPETGETFPIITERKANPEEIKGVLFYDEWYLDQENFQFRKDVKAYAPIRCYERDDDSEMPSNRYKILSWLVYDNQKVKGVKTPSLKNMTLFKKIKYEFYLEDEGISYFDAEMYNETELMMLWDKRKSSFWTSYGKETLRKFIIESALTARAVPYDFFTDEKISVQEIYQRFDAGIQETYDIDPETGMTIPIKIRKTIDYYEVKSIIFFENWYIDKETLRIYKEVVGIAPVRHYFNPEDFDLEEQLKSIPFVIYFDESKRF